jgi:peptidoglycan/xylan/chitin deacetylase (PgdA/CDA1 family)
MLLKELIVAIILTGIFGIPKIGAQDNFKASKSPPGNLTSNRVPQFVNIGFDDNAYSDGMMWILNFLRDKTNPAGMGNTATYDKTAVRTVFYFSTCFADTSTVGLKEVWRKATEDGHEIGNHTVTHEEGMAVWNKTRWKAAMDSANKWLRINLGIDRIYGFRTPFLAFSYDGGTHYAMKEAGFLYDCTLNAGSEIIGNGSDFYWPYTMDEGSPDEFYIKQVPGLWQVPTHHFMIPGGDRMTGFDYNLWARLFHTKSKFLSTVKNTLDLHYNGNRAPFTFGGHTDYYSEFNISANKECTGATWKQRREAMEEFIAYALLKPDVRIVTTINIIAWLKNPVALDLAGVNSTAEITTNQPLFYYSAVDKTIHVSLSHTGLYTITLHTANGKQIWKNNAVYSKESHTFRLNAGKLSAGVYYCTVRNHLNSTTRLLYVQ